MTTPSLLDDQTERPRLLAGEVALGSESPWPQIGSLSSHKAVPSSGQSVLAAGGPEEAQLQEEKLGPHSKSHVGPGSLSLALTIQLPPCPPLHLSEVAGRGCRHLRAGEELGGCRKGRLLRLSVNAEGTDATRRKALVSEPCAMTRRQPQDCPRWLWGRRVSEKSLGWEGSHTSPSRRSDREGCGQTRPAGCCGSEYQLSPHKRGLPSVPWPCQHPAIVSSSITGGGWGRMPEICATCITSCYDFQTKC